MARKKDKKSKMPSWLKNGKHKSKSNSAQDEPITPMVESKQQEEEEKAEAPLVMTNFPEEEKVMTTEEEDKEADLDDDDDDEQDENIYSGADSNALAYASDDPYVYSDDSESLSDAYFHPQISDFPAVMYPRSSGSSRNNPDSYFSHINNKDELIGRKVRFPETEEDALIAKQQVSTGYGTAATYGPQPNSQQHSQYGAFTATTDRTSPFKISGSIREDAPVDEEQQQLLHNGQFMYSYQSHNDGVNNNNMVMMSSPEMDAQYFKQNKKDRRRQRKAQKAAARQRQMQLLYSQNKQREQQAREQTVSQVKGRPQDERACRDPIFAYIFVAQLLFVFICAAQYGAGMLIDKNWGRLQGTVHDASITPATTIVNNGGASSSSSSPSGGSTLTTASNGAPVIQRSSSSSSSGSSSSSSSLSSSSGVGSSPKYHDDGQRLLSSEEVYQESLLVDLGGQSMQNETLDSVNSYHAPTSEDGAIEEDGTAAAASPSHEATPKSSLSSTSRKKHRASSSSSSSPSSSILQPSTSPPTNPATGSSSFTIGGRNAVALIGISGFYACVLSYLSFGFMLIMSRAIIQVTLVFSVLLALAWGMLGLTIDPYGVISVLGFAVLLLTLGYTIYNWNRVPFASTNLHTALCAMRCTGDITLLGMVGILVGFAWCIIWSMAFIGSVDSYRPTVCTEDSCYVRVTLYHICQYSFYLVSFYWTNTVIKNILRVTVASAIGTWWYYPQEISPVCSAAVGQPLLRSLTKSLGSICLGSLVSQAAQVIYIVGQCLVFMCDCRRMCSSRDNNNDEGGEEVTKEANGDQIGTPTSSVVIEDEESGVVELTKTVTTKDLVNVDEPRQFGRGIRCFNRWSFSYVGMYGYNFCEGGEKAIQLFEAREWMEVVRDNLIQNVLLMASIVIGGSTGSFAVLAEEVDGFEFTSWHKPVQTAFVIGSVLGFVLSNILLLGVVGSAVNTVLVCFAAGPFEFDRNHPRLSREMRETWSEQVWEPSH